jgi:hypothetical protein
MNCLQEFVSIIKSCAFEFIHRSLTARHPTDVVALKKLDYLTSIEGRIRGAEPSEEPSINKSWTGCSRGSFLFSKQ